MWKHYFKFIVSSYKNYIPLYFCHPVILSFSLYLKLSILWFHSFFNLKVANSPSSVLNWFSHSTFKIYIDDQSKVRLQLSRIELDLFFRSSARSETSISSAHFVLVNCFIDYLYSSSFLFMSFYLFLQHVLIKLPAKHWDTVVNKKAILCCSLPL